MGRIITVKNESVPDNVIQSLTIEDSVKVNKAWIRNMIVTSASTNFDVYIYLKSDGTYTLYENTGNNAKISDVISSSMAYEDLDGTGKLHVKCVDNSGSNTFKVWITMEDPRD